MTSSTSAFQLKGSLFTFTILQLLLSELDAIEQQLAALIKKTPAFFKHAPIIIDLQKLTNLSNQFDWHGLQQLLRKHGLIPVGVQHAALDQAEAIVAAGLALFNAERNDNAEKSNVEKSVTPPAASDTRLITQPVRSGQQLYARNGSLIVLASVSPGAELMADNHIHVYGTLRGRALAGVQGNTDARIFCQKLEAELVSIAGYYQLKDENISNQPTGPIQIYLEQQQLKILPLH